jgi:hypothetical protein
MGKRATKRLRCEYKLINPARAGVWRAVNPVAQEIARAMPERLLLRVTKRHAGCLAGTENVTLFSDAPQGPAVLLFRANNGRAQMQNRAAHRQGVIIPSAPAVRPVGKAVVRDGFAYDLDKMKHEIDAEFAGR